MTDVTAPPSGSGCVECLEAGGWWFHLRRCVECGHIGCCDSSPAQHATAHWRDTQHPVIASFEPREHWFWDYRSDAQTAVVPLTPPPAHPSDQPAPGPAGRVPVGWESQLHQAGSAPQRAAPVN